MKYILALDIGVASVGWAVIDKETETVVEACSNIFPEASAAENQLRREMRQGRRGKRRRKTRLDDFNKLWKKKSLNNQEKIHIQKRKDKKELPHGKRMVCLFLILSLTKLWN